MRRFFALHEKTLTSAFRRGADLKAKSLAFLRQHFGKSAEWYLGIANSEEDRPVVADRQRKSSGSETTFERDLTTDDAIEVGIHGLADNVWAWGKAFGRTMTVKVKFADFSQVTRSRSFPAVIVRHEMLRQASFHLVRTLLPAAKGVRLLGVTVSNFVQQPTGATDGLPLLNTRIDTMAAIAVARLNLGIALE